MTLATHVFSATSIAAGEKALQELGIEYMKEPDGSLLVKGNIYIHGMNLTALPDLSCVKVLGIFECSSNQLANLVGAPFFVRDSFGCFNNQLTSLEGAPAYVGAEFCCRNNQLTDLTGAPTFVGGSFFCENNQLISLKGAPDVIKEGAFVCYHNRLTDLKGAPVFARGFLCHDNPLTTLEGGPTSVEHFDCHNCQLSKLDYAPRKFAKLLSDFGEFTSEYELSEYIRLADEKAEQQVYRDIHGGVKQDIPVPKPLKLPKPGRTP